MPTDTARGPTDAAKFALRGVAWSLGLFGLLRLNWTEAHVVLPFTRAAGRGWRWDCSARRRCRSRSRSRAAAPTRWRCASGAVLAYPVTWRTRLAGAAGGAALILGLNTVRIGTLGRAAASPAWFNALHVYVWPAAAHARDRRIRVRVDAPRGSPRTPRGRDERRASRIRVRSRRARSRRDDSSCSRRLSAPVSRPPRRSISRVAGVLALAGFIARAAAAILGVVGVSAHAAANVLWTPRGGFLVTQECISTPLIPVYLAAVCAYSTTWRRLILGVLATLPLFIALGIARLLVVALPDAVVASPLFLVHAFYQLLLGAVVVFLAALWRHGGRAALGHALAGVIVGVAVRPVCSARSTRASSRIRPARRSTIRRERSRSFPRSRSASISRSGSRRSSPSAGGASSPGSRCSGSRRRRACSRCTPSPATPA